MSKNEKAGGVLCSVQERLATRSTIPGDVGMSYSVMGAGWWPTPALSAIQLLAITTDGALILGGSKLFRLMTNK